jgi:hypothetical protein
MSSKERQFIYRHLIPTMENRNKNKNDIVQDFEIQH